MTQLIEPHGGILCDLLIQGEKLNQLKKDSLHLESLILNDRQLCDIEMLLNGSFSNGLAYESVLGLIKELSMQAVGN